MHGDAESAGERVVWGRGQIAATRCPKSIITAESLYLLDEFNIWKRCPNTPLHKMPARVVDAILVLESEFRAEVVAIDRERHGQSVRR